MVVHPAAGHASVPERAAAPPAASAASCGHRAPSRSRYVWRDGVTRRTRSCRGSSTTASREQIHRPRVGVVQAGRRIDAAYRAVIPSDWGAKFSRSSSAREAVTRITRAMPLPGLTLCQVDGRNGTHQIRVHLSAIGHPVVGDSVTVVCTAGWRATSAPCSGSNGPSCMPRGWCSRTPAMLMDMTALQDVLDALPSVEKAE